MVNKKFVLIGLLLVILDQITKALVVASNPNINFFAFVINFVKNTGAFWGWFKDSNLIFIWISLFALGLLIYFYDQFPEKASLFYTFLITGILGNLIDRLFRGFVVDFIDFRFWPVFNIADMMLFFGIVGIIYYVWKEDNSRNSSRSSNLLR